MKILYVHNILWSHYKNALLSQLYQQIAEKHPEWTFKVVQVAKNEALRAALPMDELPHYPYTLLFDDLWESSTLFQKINRLSKTVYSFNPDVICIPGFGSPLWVFLFFLSKILGKKIIIANDSTLAENKNSSLWKTWIKKIIVRYSHMYLCFGTGSVHYFKSLGENKKAIWVSPCASVDDITLEKKYQEALISAPLQPRSIIYIGRLSPEKNLFRLIEAFSNFQKKNFQDWSLTLLGDGALKSELHTFILKENIKNIHFESPKKWFEIPKYLAYRESIILSSTSEPWGLVINEAMLCRLPVLVSSACGCAQDLVEEGRNGYLFNPLDIPNISETLEKFASQTSEKRKEMGLVSYTKIQNYSLKNTVNRIIEGFEELTLFHL